MSKQLHAHDPPELPPPLPLFDAAAAAAATGARKMPRHGHSHRPLSNAGNLATMFMLETRISVGSDSAAACWAAQLRVGPCSNRGSGPAAALYVQQGPWLSVHAECAAAHLAFQPTPSVLPPTLQARTNPVSGLPDPRVAAFAMGFAGMPPSQWTADMETQARAFAVRSSRKLACSAAAAACSLQPCLQNAGCWALLHAEAACSLGVGALLPCRQKAMPFAVRALAASSATSS